MSHDYLEFLLKIGARSAIVLVFMVIGFRLLGKRQLGQMNIYDLALIMCLANAVQNAMTLGKGELSVGLVSAGALLLMGRLFTTLLIRAPRLEHSLVGTPTVLINDGRPVAEHMRRECITEDQLLAVVRQHGLTSLSDVKMAILEVDGTLSIIPKEHPPGGKQGRHGSDANTPPE